MSIRMISSPYDMATRPVLPSVQKNYIYIYIARIPSRIPSHLSVSFRENTYIYDAHTLAHTRALMCTEVHIYIVRIPSRIPILHKHAFPDRLAGTALRGTSFPWAAHTPRILKCVSSQAWRAHWLLSGPRKEKETIQESEHAVGERSK